MFSRRVNLAAALVLFAALFSACSGSAGASLTAANVNPIILVNAVRVESADCIAERYTPEELVSAVESHIELVRSDDLDANDVPETPLQRYFACFPASDAGADEAYLGLVRALAATFPADEPPPNGLTLLGLPDDTLNAWIILGAMPDELDGFVFNGNRESRSITYGPAGDNTVHVLVRATSESDGPALTAGDLLAERIFMLPPKLSGVDIDRVSAGYTEGMVWAHMRHSSGGETPGEMLAWGKHGGSFVWTVWAKDKGDLAVAVEALKQAAERSLGLIE